MLSDKCFIINKSTDIRTLVDRAKSDGSELANWFIWHFGSFQTCSKPCAGFEMAMAVLK